MALGFLDGWYVGDTADDLAEFLRQHGADGYQVHEIRHSACEACRGDVFGVEGSLEDPTVARRTCRRCGHRQYIADSGEYWDGEQVYVSVCACEEEDFAVAVGFSLYRDSGVAGVRSLAMAERCLACGKIASLGEWMVRTGDMTLLDRA